MPRRQRLVRRKVYRWNRIDNDGLHRSLEGMADDVQSVLEHGAPVNDMWDCLSKRCCKAIDEHIPSKLTSQRYNQSWTNTKIKRISRSKKLLHRALKTMSSKDRAAYQEAKKYTQSECRKAYYRYINDMVVKPSKGELHSLGRFWAFIKSKQCDNSGVSRPKKVGISHSDSQVKPDILNQ